MTISCSHPSLNQLSLKSQSLGVLQDIGGHGLTSVAGSGQAGGVTAAGWASVENQEDMADLAVVNAPPTDWPESRDGEMLFIKLVLQDIF